jgi:hypothetical protein
MIVFLALELLELFQLTSAHLFAANLNACDSFTQDYDIFICSSTIFSTATITTITFAVFAINNAYITITTADAAASAIITHTIIYTSTTANSRAIACHAAISGGRIVQQSAARARPLDSWRWRPWLTARRRRTSLGRRLFAIVATMVNFMVIFVFVLIEESSGQLPKHRVFFYVDAGDLGGSLRSFVGCNACHHDRQIVFFLFFHSCRQVVIAG